MGYFLHRLKDERSLYRGQEIRAVLTAFFATNSLQMSVQISGSEEATLTYRISPTRLSLKSIRLRFHSRSPTLCRASWRSI